MRGFSTLALFVTAICSGLLAAYGPSQLLRTGITTPANVLHAAVVVSWIVCGLCCLVILKRALRSIRVFLWLVLAIGLIAAGIYAANENQHLEYEGVAVVGITGKKVHELTKHYLYGVIYTRTTDRYLLDYTFNVGWKTYSRQGVSVNKSTWDAAETNQTLPVKYWSRDPGTSEIDLPDERNARSSLPWVAFVCAGILFLIAGRIWSRSGPVRKPMTAAEWRARGLRR